MDPFDIFPVKVWEEILHRLEDPTAKLNIIKSNRSFQLLELFQEKGADWKFSEVIGIVIGHLYRPYSGLIKWSRRPWHKKGELESAVLNCRRVSKGTKKTVDSFAELSWEKSCWFPRFASPAPLLTTEHVGKCLVQADQLKDKNISPLSCSGVLNIVVLCADRWNFGGNENKIRLRPSPEKAAQLVSHPNIGNNLRGVCVMISFGTDELQRTFNFLRKLLQSAPNIRTLTILFQSLGNGVTMEQDHDLPELPYLTHLELSELIKRNEEDALLQHYVDFKQYFEQLTYFEMSFSLWKEQYNGGQVQFPKLKTFLLNKVPISGRGDDILDIVENLNAPALDFWIFETQIYNAILDSQTSDDFQFFMFGMVSKAIKAKTPDQNWNMVSSPSKCDRLYRRKCTYIGFKL